MPELPEVETTKTSLTPLLGLTVTQVTVKQPSLRWAVPIDLHTLCNQQLLSIDRRAKYLILNFSQNKVIVHLGMSGSLTITTPDLAHRKHDHVFIQFGQLELRYHDPRRFGCVMWLDDTIEQKLLHHLAPEPLTDEFTANYLHQILSAKQTAIKTMIMDQRFVVGVGNIYATESLFHCRLHPLRAASSLTFDETNALFLEIKQILARAIKLGGSSLRDYVSASGETGYFQQTLDVYGRVNEPCKQCHTILQSVLISQRTSVFCPTCQPMSL